MKNASKRSLWMLLAVVMVVGLLIGMPASAHASNTQDLADKINEFKHEGSGTLMASVSGNTVTVTGSVTGVSKSLSLIIDNGTTLVWKADYSGDTSILLTVNGSGECEIPAGVTLENTDGIAVWTQGSLKVTGATIRSANSSAIATGYGYTVIEITDGLIESDNNAFNVQHCKLTINGGSIISKESIAISNSGDGAITTINGGTISAASVAIMSGLDGSSVTVNGGIVETCGGSNAISTKNITMTGGIVRTNGESTGLTKSSAIYVTGDLVVSGGLVSAEKGYAIITGGVNATLSIDGGFLFAYGKTVLVDDIFARDNFAINNSGGADPTTIAGNSVVCAWDQGAGVTSYEEGTTDGLDVLPSGASALWGIDGTEYGIYYANGTNHGFFPINGVTVTPAQPGGNIPMSGTVDPTDSSASDNTPADTADNPASVTSSDPQPLSILLDGELVTADSPPFVDENSRTMVPARFISEALGADVQWDDEAQLVTVTSGSTVIEITIGSNRIITNGKSTRMDTRATLVDGRTFVPVRFIAEALSLTVGWDGDTNTVLLTTGNE